MKPNNIFVRAIVLMLAASWTAHARGETFSHSESFDTDSLTIITSTTPEGNTFSEINWPGETMRKEMDEPMVPVRYINVRVPENSNAFSASVISATRKERIELQYPLKPFKDCTTSEDPSGISYATLSGTGYTASTRSATAEITNEFFLNGSDHYVTFAVHPVAYNGEENALYVYDNVEVELSFNRCDTKDMKFRPLKSQGFTQMYDSAALDYFEVSICDKKLAKPLMKAAVSDNYELEMQNATDYVILVPESLEDGVEELAAWKRQQGFQVTVISPEAILANPSYSIGATQYCVDKESSIREWMRDFYQTNGAFYCLIIGDWRTSAPIRKIHVTEKGTPAWSNERDYNDSAYDPSDYYFTDLVTDFPLVNIHGFHCIDRRQAVDLTFSSPTIAVGRLLCQSKAEITRYVRKLKLYEYFPGKGDSEYLVRGVLVRESNLPGYGTMSIDSKHIFESLPFEVTTFISNHVYDESLLSPKASEVVNAMSSSGLYSFQCHAGPIAFQVAERANNGTTNPWPPGRMVMALQKYKDSNSRYAWGLGMDLMDNPNKPAILYSLGCDPAPFDSLVVRTLNKATGEIIASSEIYDYNIGSAFTVAGDFGGPLALLNTREGWSDTSMALEQKFSEALRRVPYNSAGILENISKIVHPQTNSYFSDARIRHSIIGDPSIRIWTNTPNIMKKAWRLCMNEFSFRSSDSIAYYGVTFGSESMRSYNINRNGMVINLNDIIQRHSNIGIGSISFFGRSTLPETFLLTPGP